MLTLEILSPEKTIFRGSVERVTLPGQSGGFTVLPRHAPLISVLVRGDIKYLPEGADKEAVVKIESGFAEVKQDTVSVCVEFSPDATAVKSDLPCE